MFVAIKAILPWKKRGDEWRRGEEVQGGDEGRGNEREVKKKVREKSNFLQPPHLFDCDE